ncbi:MAG TPA: hypothetical protein VFI46_10890, partial [Jiangellaceae bacterium]|nr:hypothetical protein [Jiangellaceae bacterium]
IAAAGTWRRLLTDPATGALLDHGTTRYTPPQDLIDHILARDGTCRFPTVRREALVDRVEVRDLRRRLVAAGRSKLRAA